MELLLTADDFGRDPAVNAAVRQAHEAATLTGASLMVTGDAWQDAVALARSLPRLAVGLHVAVSDARPLLPPASIPHLVDATGRFPASPAKAGLRYFFNPRARLELRREIEAQFDRFAATGLPLAHVDGHQHMHMHPVVWDIVAPLAQRYGAPRIRIPHDELAFALRFDPHHLAAKIATTCVFRLLERRARRCLRGTALRALPTTYGFLMSGRMHERYLQAILRHLHGPAEIYFHPRAAQRLDRLGPNPTDLAALLSPQVRKLLGTSPQERTATAVNAAGDSPRCSSPNSSSSCVPSREPTGYAPHA